MVSEKQYKRIQERIKEIYGDQWVAGFELSIQFGIEEDYFGIQIIVSNAIQ